MSGNSSGMNFESGPALAVYQITCTTKPRTTLLMLKGVLHDAAVEKSQTKAYPVARPTARKRCGVQDIQGMPALNRAEAERLSAEFTEVAHHGKLQRTLWLKTHDSPTRRRGCFHFQHPFTEGVCPPMA